MVAMVVRTAVHEEGTIANTSSGTVYPAAFGGKSAMHRI